MKELELLKCVLPDKFVAGCMIAKWHPSWKNFATTLNHKRHEISVEILIAYLDVEEKLGPKILLRNEVRFDLPPIWCRGTHITRTKGRTSLPRLLPSRRRSLKRLS